MAEKQKDILIQALANAELRYQTDAEGEVPAYVGELKPEPGGWEEGYIFWRTQYMRRSPLFQTAVYFFRDYEKWRKKQKAQKAAPYAYHIGINAITLSTDFLYHDPFVATLEPMPVEKIFRTLDSTPKKYPAQKGLLFHKSMPFRAGFLNFSDAPHSLQMRIDYTKPVSHILRYGNQPIFSNGYE